MPRRPARFTQADIARALRAVGQTGARVAVEITPDGTIRIVPAGKGDASAADRCSVANAPEIVL
jgi:hypothetical protein